MSDLRYFTILFMLVVIVLELALISYMVRRVWVAIIRHSGSFQGFLLALQHSKVMVRVVAEEPVTVGEAEAEGRHPAAQGKPPTLQ
jgi:positive regulator of sigma E activity